MTSRLVIVGAGRAGAHAAMQARSAGFAGKVVLIGDEPYAPYDRPPLSKDVLLGKADADSLQLFGLDEYARLSIELVRHARVDAIERQAHMLQCDDGRAISYDKLMIATGARARRLELGQGQRGVFYLRTLDDAATLRSELTPGRRIAIIGAGYIGLEVAATARQRGCDVVVLEAGANVMSRVLSPETAAVLAALHRRHGVEVLTGAQVSAIDTGANPVMIRLSDDSRLTADVVLVGIGAEPVDELAREAGLETDGGILVDAHGLTSDPDIYAVGDVARFHHPTLNRTIRLESWQHAERHAQAACNAMLGNPTPYDDVPWFWSQQYDLTLQMVGLIDGHDDFLFRGDISSETFTAIYLRQGRVIAACAFNQARDITPLRRIIARQSRPPRELLSDPATDLRPLCRL